MAAAVPQRILGWLHNILRNDYRHVDRTYSDVAQTLQSYPNLIMRTDIYTFDNGSSSLLLNVQGTLPVTFRGTTFGFPISLWIPQGYPDTAPLAFVTPTKEMVIRAGQHISGEGRVYHPYLADWRAERSALVGLLSLLQQIFAREPPVVARVQPAQRQIYKAQQNGERPPIPPLPPEMENARSQSQHLGRPQDKEQPPPRPPKSGYSSPLKYDKPAALPAMTPHSQHLNSHADQRQLSQQDRFTAGQHAHLLHNYHQANRSGQYGHRGQPLAHIFPPEERDYHGARSPVSPMSEFKISLQEQHDVNIAPNPNSHRHHLPYDSAFNHNPSHAPEHRDARSYSQPSQQFHHHQQYQQYPPNIPQQPKSMPPEDLLTSPFDTAIPTPVTNVAPPPIPPNPQKDALLSALSETLTQQILSTHTSNMSAIAPLHAQQSALRSTLDAVGREISQLDELEQMLTSNEGILHQAMRDADKVLEDAKRRKVPNVDDVLVPPTVVAGQLYQTVAEERSIEDCRNVMGKALDKGRIGSGVWAKQTRSLAREEFLKKTLIKKIARGMGLAEQRPWH